jgi:hypothetical protein
MFRHLFPFRRLLATSFLLVFVNVFVGQCWCATMMQPMRAGLASKPAAHCGAEAPAKPTHPGCHGHGIAKADHHQAGHPAKKPARSHDCCKDKSASLLSSLTTPAEKQLFTPAPALLPAAADFQFPALTAGQWDRTAAVRLVPPQHLPPKIPDIRIFIQSLTV